MIGQSTSTTINYTENGSSSGSPSPVVCTRSTTGIPYEFWNTSCSPYNIVLSTTLTVSDTPDNQQDIQLLRCGNPGYQSDLVLLQSSPLSQLPPAYTDIQLPEPSKHSSTDSYTTGTLLPIRTVVSHPGSIVEPSASASNSTVQNGLLVAYSFIVDHYSHPDTKEDTNITSSIVSGKLLATTTNSTVNTPSTVPSVDSPRQWIFQGRTSGRNNNRNTCTPPDSSLLSLWRTIDERTLPSSYFIKDPAHTSSKDASILHYPWIAYLPTYNINSSMDEYRIVIKDIHNSEGNHSKKYPGRIYISKVRLYYATVSEKELSTSSIPYPFPFYTTVVHWYWQLFLVGPCNQRRLRLVSSDRSIDVLSTSLLYIPSKWTASITIHMQPIPITDATKLMEFDQIEGQNVQVTLMIDQLIVPLVPYSSILRQIDGEQVQELSNVIACIPRSQYMDTNNTNNTLSILVGQDDTKIIESISQPSRDPLTNAKCISPRQISIAYDAPFIINDPNGSSPFLHQGFNGLIHSINITPPPASVNELVANPILSTFCTLGKDKSSYVINRSLCTPLHTLEHVLLWNSPLIDDSNSIDNPALISRYRADSNIRSVVPLQIRQKHRSNQNSLTLVCHDCGPSVYKEDNHFRGIRNSSVLIPQSPDSSSEVVPVGHMYRFENWSFVDIFVYFSHERVSIPPIGWINACHRNGTRILGTIITEWSDGENANILLTFPYYTAVTTTATVTPMNRSLLAYKLAQIAAFYGFDGWLVNIEASVDNGKNGVHHLLQFLRDLTTFVHQLLPPSPLFTRTTGGLVIWYDSIHADTGNVSWQSELNAANEIFLQNCDGIFLDYHWNKQMVQNTVTYKANLSDRSKPVFMGIDMWGRGTYGGGGWKTFEAVNLIKDMTKDNSLSIAFFGPAWTYEAMNGTKNSSYFRKLEQRMWQGKAPTTDNDTSMLRVSVPVINPNGILPNISSSITSSALANSKLLQQKLQLFGWTITNDDTNNNSQGWNVVVDDEPIPDLDTDNNDEEVNNDNEMTKTCFVTSHKWCWASQTVPLTMVPIFATFLSAFTEKEEPQQSTVQVSIEISEWYKGSGPNYEDQYQCKLSLLNNFDTLIRGYLHTSEVLTCSNTWKKYTYLFPNVSIPNPLFQPDNTMSPLLDNLVTKVKIEHGGKDIECWAGHFGTRIKGTTVTLLVDPTKIRKFAATKGNETLSVPGMVKLNTNNGLIHGLGAPAFHALPIQTSFNTGIGANNYKDGSRISHGTWCNLSDVELLPPFLYHHANIIPRISLPIQNYHYQPYHSLHETYNSFSSTFVNNNSKDLYYSYNGLSYDHQIAWNGSTSLVYGSLIPFSFSSIQETVSTSTSNLHGHSRSEFVSFAYGYDSFRLFPLHLLPSSRNTGISYKGIKVTMKYDVFIKNIDYSKYSLEYSILPILFSYDTVSATIPLLLPVNHSVNPSVLSRTNGWNHGTWTFPYPSISSMDNNYEYSVMGISIMLRIRSKEENNEVSVPLSALCLVRIGYLSIDEEE